MDNITYARDLRRQLMANFQPEARRHAVGTSEASVHIKAVSIL